MKSLARKVPLEDFIDILMDIYETGALYIDIFTVRNDDRDVLTIAVKEEYMGEEPPVDIPLSDEFLNSLI